MIKWLLWIVIVAILTFGGWALKDEYPAPGKFAMAFGWILGGFLLCYAAYQNLKNK